MNPQIPYGNYLILIKLYQSLIDLKKSISVISFYREKDGFSDSSKAL